VLRTCRRLRPWICPLSDGSFFPFSVQRGGRVEIIANDQGHRITPSWVAFTDEERLYVPPFFFFPNLPPRAYPETRIGDSAKNAFHSNPTNTVFDAKRLIGRKIAEPDLQRDIKHWWVRFLSCPFRSYLLLTS
jgi:molecular chaperone DnaK (HSP70)